MFGLDPGAVKYAFEKLRVTHFVDIDCTFLFSFLWIHASWWIDIALDWLVWDFGLSLGISHGKFNSVCVQRTDDWGYGESVALIVTTKRWLCFGTLIPVVEPVWSISLGILSDPAAPHPRCR
jgi:hypothetical protein